MNKMGELLVEVTILAVLFTILAVLLLITTLVNVNHCGASLSKYTGYQQ